jgi:hypothetical protein
VPGLIAEAAGRTITYRELSFGEDRDTMIGAGVPDQALGLAA